MCGSDKTFISYSKGFLAYTPVSRNALYQDSILLLLFHYYFECVHSSFFLTDYSYVQVKMMICLMEEKLNKEEYLWVSLHQLLSAL